MARLREIKKNYGKARPHWREASADFLVHQRAEDGIGAKTITDYKSRVKLFFKRFPDAWDKEKELKETLVAHLADEIKAATFNNRLVYLRGFFNYCVEEVICQSIRLRIRGKRRSIPARLL
ncbi:site-specific integrase [Paenibacillus pabuli]|uniref:site-specific integrase n=1 Tax=Paenibacillus pabuli TaxID=1472 RepID=UPI003CFA5406